MIDPNDILAILPPDRVSYCVPSIHHKLLVNGADRETTTIVSVQDTLRLMACNGDVEEDGDGWIRRERPKAIKQQQGSLFG